ncbi:MAG: TraR/DksA C4-type zinc finger protein [Actinomycetota bacterium]
MAKTTKRPKDYSAVEEKLRAEREDLVRQIGEIEARYSGDEKVDQRDDEGEPETITYERERDISLLDNAQDLLDQVDRALQKIEAGTYGVCANCGKNIEAARLRALPHASLCISCKRKEERR